jgi:large subunit ribosomal protein L18e
MKKAQELISELKKKADEQDSKLLRRIASDLERPNRIMREVNLSRINRVTKKDETIVVPGKVLGGGEIDHKVIVYALKFSQGALSKLEKSGSVAVQISDIAKEPVKGKKIRIIG